MASYLKSCPELGQDTNRRPLPAKSGPVMLLAGGGLFPDLSRLSFRDTAKPQQIVTKINQIYFIVVV